MKEIIKAQGGNTHMSSETLKPGRFTFEIEAKMNGTVKKIHSKNATVLAKILGAPDDKKAGIYLNKKIGQKIKKGEVLYTLYSSSVYNLKEAKDSLKHFPLFMYN